MPPRRGWGNFVAWVATKISLLTELSDGARLCPQDQSQQVEDGEVCNYFNAPRKLDVLRLGVATAALQPQRGCSIQPSVGAQRLRWMEGRMKTTLNEL